MKQEYNWWTDPKNKEKVEVMSWWNHPENQKVISLPVAIVQDNKHWTITGSEETKKLLGDLSKGCVSGKTEEEAIRRYFHTMRMMYNYHVEKYNSYKRWVPFRKGQWGSIGGTWFVVFGIQVYLRYGNKMKGGWYIPFTKLNISIYNEWITYHNWKNNKNKENE